MRSYTEAKRNYNKEWYHRNFARAQATQIRTRLRKYFGLTVSQYEAMFAAQQGKCAVCGRHQSEETIRLAVDPDHITGKVRELLCKRCNWTLGQAKDSAAHLRKLANYLDKHSVL